MATDLLQSLLEATRTAPVQTASFLSAVTSSLRRVLKAFPVLLDQFVEICEELRSVGGEALFNLCVDVFDLPP